MSPLSLAAIGIHSDSAPWASLGRILALPRASHVEFDMTEQQWVARDARSSRIIPSNSSREAVLREEHEHYTKRDRPRAPA